MVRIEFNMLSSSLNTFGAFQNMLAIDLFFLGFKLIDLTTLTSHRI